jgi:hypothetical protein
MMALAGQPLALLERLLKASPVVAAFPTQLLSAQVAAGVALEALVLMAQAVKLDYLATAVLASNLTSLALPFTAQAVGVAARTQVLPLAEMVAVATAQVQG